MQILVFQLYAPMASWGLPATGEDRPSATMPTRSAVLGLIAAAVGIPRHDQTRLDALARALQVGAARFSAGVPRRDYHTTQVPGASREVHRATRRDELGADKLNTILSSREYRCDGYWRVAIQAEPDSPWSLQALAEALDEPVFPLYLGRKSCPPAAPLDPVVVDADGMRGALTSPRKALTSRGLRVEARLLGADGSVAFVWEGDAQDMAPHETRHVHDDPADRARWQFGSRHEHWRIESEEQ